MAFNTNGSKKLFLIIGLMILTSCSNSSNNISNCEKTTLGYLCTTPFTKKYCTTFDGLEGKEYYLSKTPLKRFEEIMKRPIGCKGICLTKSEVSDLKLGELIHDEKTFNFCYDKAI